MPPEIIAAYLVYREAELLDGVVTAAALLFRVDGSLQPVERHRLVDVLADEEFLFVFTREEILDALERQLQALRQADGVRAAVERLKCFSGLPQAGLLFAVAEEIAAADCRIDGREKQMLELIRMALNPPSSITSAAGSRAGAKK